MGATEGTIPPGRRELEEARRRGAVAVSPELVGLGALLAGAATLWATWPAALDQLLGLFREGMAGAAAAGADPGAALEQGLWVLAGVAGPVLAAALCGALAVGMVQTRGLFMFAGTREGDSAPAGPGGLRGLRALVLLAAGAGLSWAVWRHHAPALVGSLGRHPAEGLAVATGALSSLVLALFPLLLLLGAVDLLGRRLALRRALALTPTEARARLRAREGDPLLRGERRRLHRLLGRGGGAREVARRACLVVSAGGELAVALEYLSGKMTAPVVLALGRGGGALPLLEAAHGAGIPVADRPTLAASLTGLEEGMMIPAVLYEEVAGLLRDSRLTVNGRRSTDDG